jgi:hypothetical protein
MARHKHSSVAAASSERSDAPAEEVAAAPSGEEPPSKLKITSRLIFVRARKSRMRLAPARLSCRAAGFRTAARRQRPAARWAVQRA